MEDYLQSSDSEVHSVHSALDPIPRGGKSASRGVVNQSLRLVSPPLLHLRFIKHLEWRDESAITAQNEQAAMKKKATIMRDIRPVIGAGHFGMKGMQCE